MADYLAIHLFLCMLIVLFHTVTPVVHGGGCGVLVNNGKCPKLIDTGADCSKEPKPCNCKQRKWNRRITTCGSAGSNTATSAGGLDELGTIGKQHRNRSRSGDPGKKLVD